jgi:hypothetical protein
MPTSVLVASDLDALIANLAAEKTEREIADAALDARLDVLEAAVPPPPPPPVDPPPTGTPDALVNNTSELLAALAAGKKNIRVKTGVTLGPITITTAHGGTQANPCVVKAENDGDIRVNLNGASSYGFAVKALGAHDIEFHRLVAYNGNVNQMGVFTIGDGGSPTAPGNKRLKFVDCKAESTITGPQTNVGGTNAATAHFAYMSVASSTHDDIVFIRPICEAVGLGAMFHFYASNGGSVRFIADGWKAYHVSQVIMAYAGTITDAQLINGYAENCGYVLRGKVGNGTVTGTHHGTINQPIHPDTTSNWIRTGLTAV